MQSDNKLLHVNDTDGQYPPSWYAATADFLEPFPPLEGEHKTAICIIGGGYTGLSAALHLRRSGHDVTLLEAQRVGWGASGRNGGQVGSGQRKDVIELERLLGKEAARAAFDIGIAAPRLVRDLIAEFNIDCAYKAGIIHANHRARFDAGSKRYVDYLNSEYGYRDIEYLDPQQLGERLGASGYSAGTIDWNAGHLHPLNYALGLARAAAKTGAKIYEGTEVISINKGAPVEVKTATGTVVADHVVLACNGYLGELDHDVASHVMPINNYIIATEPLGENLARALIVDDVAVSDSRFVVNYYRCTADHRLLFGGGENYGYHFPADIKEFVRQPMLDVFPQLKDTGIDYGWGGTLAITMSRLPYFKRLDSNIISASGYSGSGVALATMAGKLIAETINGDDTRFDVMAKMSTPSFPGGTALRHPLLVLAMLWYGLRDRL